MQVKEIISGWKRRKKRGPDKTDLYKSSTIKRTGGKNTHLMHAEELVFQQKQGAEPDLPGLANEWCWWWQSSSSKCKVDGAHYSRH